MVCDSYGDDVRGGEPPLVVDEKLEVDEVVGVLMEVVLEMLIAVLMIVEVVLDEMMDEKT